MVGDGAPASWRLRRETAAALVAILGQSQPTAVPELIRRNPGLLASSQFLRSAEHHRITPAVYVALKDFPEVPPTLLEALARDHHEQIFRHTAALGDLRMLGDMLDGLGVRWAVVKGPHLASYVHERPDLRTYNDLDVLIDHRRLPEVVAALEAAGHPVLDRNWTLIREGERAQVGVLLPLGIPLDLHWHLLNRGPVRHAFSLDVDALLDRVQRRRLGSVDASVLQDEDALIHLGLHASLAGASRLVWIHDVHVFMTRRRPDLDLVVARANEAGAGLALAVVLQRAQATFGTVLDDDLLARLASPFGWRAVTKVVDRVRPVETGFDRRYMGRTVVRATRADSASSLREFRRTGTRNAARRLRGIERVPIDDSDELNALYEESGDLADRDAFFAAVADPGAATADLDAPGLRVLMLPNPSLVLGNPYVPLLVDELRREGMRVGAFSLRAATLSEYDVVHVQWPEASLGIANPTTATSRTLRLLLALVVARARGIPVMWTAHNLRSHERPHPRLERLFWWAFPRLLSGWLSLSEAGAAEMERALPTLARRPHWVTTHGHYRDSYPAIESSADPIVTEPVLLHVGHIRAYKNVPALVEAFRGMTTPARLVIAGSCHPPTLAEDVTTAVAGDERVELVFGRVPDGEMTQLLDRAALVVLPYRETLNSGTALLALSFNRPVLLPRTPVYEELQQRVGPAWLHLYDGPITAAALEAVLRDLEKAGERLQPALGADFDWPKIARATVAAYRAVLA